MIIRTMCEACKMQINLEPEDIKLVHGDRATYKFVCSSCKEPNNKPTDDKIIDLLLTSGVDWEEEVIALHPETPDPDASPLTIDDLIELHKELEEM